MNLTINLRNTAIAVGTFADNVLTALLLRTLLCFDLKSPFFNNLTSEARVLAALPATSGTFSAGNYSNSIILLKVVKGALPDWSDAAVTNIGFTIRSFTCNNFFTRQVGPITNQRAPLITMSIPNQDISDSPVLQLDRQLVYALPTQWRIQLPVSLQVTGGTGNFSRTVATAIAGQVVSTQGILNNPAPAGIAAAMITTPNVQVEAGAGFSGNVNAQSELSLTLELNDLDISTANTRYFLIGNGEAAIDQTLLADGNLCINAVRSVYDAAIQLPYWEITVTQNNVSITDTTPEIILTPPTPAITGVTQIITRSIAIEGSTPSSTYLFAKSEL